MVLSRWAIIKVVFSAPNCLTCVMISASVVASRLLVASSHKRMGASVCVRVRVCVCVCVCMCISLREGGK
jgi:hypothetical protein